MQELDLATEAWTEIATMPVPRKLFACGFVDTEFGSELMIAGQVK